MFSLFRTQKAFLVFVSLHEQHSFDASADVIEEGNQDAIGCIGGGGRNTLATVFGYLGRCARSTLTMVFSFPENRPIPARLKTSNTLTGC
jgi:hypothetical protein